MVWCGVVWCGVVWSSVEWCGVVWCGVVWCGVEWCGGCGGCNVAWLISRRADVFSAFLKSFDDTPEDYDGDVCPMP